MDLFSTTSVAYGAANYAYSHNGGSGSFSLTNTELSTSWTALQYDSDNPTANLFSDSANANNAIYQVTCTLNNTSTTSNLTTYKLNGVTYPSTGGLTGVGTVNGWQTQTNQGMYCALPSGSSSPSTYYDYIMKSGWSNAPGTGGNGQFIEVQSDAAFTDIASCAAQLTLATTSLQANNPATATCPYP